MPDYRRAYVPGGTFFFTIVTYDRRILFENPRNIQTLRNVLAQVRTERPFEFDAGVVLPHHLHFIWTLPEADSDYSSRIGRMKALFTKGFLSDTTSVGSAHPTESRARHREADVWQRRFWEHVIRDESDYEHHINYIHFNPVKHGLVNCPHHWKYSSFSKWVATGGYESAWCCACGGKVIRAPYPAELDRTVGE